jgi:hypothetical protein
MADPQGDKQRIMVALAASRTELRILSLLVRRNLNIRRYLLESRERHQMGGGIFKRNSNSMTVAHLRVWSLASSRRDLWLSSRRDLWARCRWDL